MHPHGRRIGDSMKSAAKPTKIPTKLMAKKAGPSAAL
jgi:hypothetical protein